MNELDRAWPILEAAVARSLHTVTKHDVAQGLASGSLKLVSTEKSAVVIELAERGGKRFMNFFLAAGDLEELQDIAAFYEVWARQEGFDAITIVGRRGWGAALPGYKEQSVIFEKLLKD